MRQSLGMSQQLNIIIVFILTVFALVAASLSYYKSFKVNNVIVNSIEKYEGYNDLSIEEINKSLAGLGYQKNYTCESKPYDNNDKEDITGYCVTYKKHENGYSYQVTTYMYIDLPLINIIKIPIRSNTKRMCLGNESC